jgi:hypothetical protein
VTLCLWFWSSRRGMAGWHGVDVAGWRRGGRGWLAHGVWPAGTGWMWLAGAGGVAGWHGVDVAGWRRGRGWLAGGGRGWLAHGAWRAGRGWAWLAGTGGRGWLAQGPWRAGTRGGRGRLAHGVDVAGWHTGRGRTWWPSHTQARALAHGLRMWHTRSNSGAASEVGVPAPGPVWRPRARRLNPVCELGNPCASSATCVRAPNPCVGQPGTHVSTGPKTPRNATQDSLRIDTQGMMCNIGRRGRPTGMR